MTLDTSICAEVLRPAVSEIMLTVILSLRAIPAAAAALAKLSLIMNQLHTERVAL